MPQTPRPEDFQDALVIIVDVLIRNDRQWISKDSRGPAKYVEWLEKMGISNQRKLEELTVSLRNALQFLFEFFDAAGFDVKASEKWKGGEVESDCGSVTRRTLGMFLKDYSDEFPNPKSLKDTLTAIARLFPTNRATLQTRNVAFPVNLFRHAESSAESSGNYRMRNRQKPIWWSQLHGGKRDSPKLKEDGDKNTRGDRRLKMAVLRCWLHECDRTPGNSEAWKIHCHAGCMYEMLTHHQFSTTEIELCLNCGNSRAASGYCNRPIPMSDDPGGPSLPDDRPERAAKRRERAREFACAMVSTENLPSLLSELTEDIWEPKAPPRQAETFWQTWPWKRIGFASALTIVALVALLIVVPRQPAGFTIAMRSDPDRTPTVVPPPYIQSLPSPLNVTMKRSGSIFTVESPLGDRLVLRSKLTNNIAAGGRLWAGAAILEGTLQGNRPVTGSAEIRIRTATPRSLSELKTSDLEWVSFEMNLTNSLTPGTLSLVFGNP